MVPFWMYVELPLFLLVGTLMRVAKCKEKTVLMMWGTIGIITILGDYFIVAPLLQVFYSSFVALCIATGICVLGAWVGWRVTNKILERRQGGQ